MTALNTALYQIKLHVCLNTYGEVGLERPLLQTFQQNVLWRENKHIYLSVHNEDRKRNEGECV